MRSLCGIVSHPPRLCLPLASIHDHVLTTAISPLGPIAMTDTRSPTILPDLSQQLAQMQAMIDKLAQENASLRAQPLASLKCKITDKGALSVYGLGQWPVTLYRSQWDRLIPFVPEIKAFIMANAHLLTVKAPKA